jgi:hypothetical protein
MSFHELDVQAPPGMKTGVIPAEARRVPVPDNTGRTRTFWIAPTRRGGWCLDIADVGGGCEKLGTIPLGTTWGAEGRAVPSQTRDHPVITEIYGSANAEWVDSVAITFDDGEVAHPSVVWVSKPIDAGFFFFEVPPEHRTAGHEVASVEAYDAAGKLVTRETDRASANEAGPPPDAVVAQKQEIGRAAGADGDAVLWIAPTRYDATCSWVEIGGKSHAANCTPEGYLGELGGSQFVLVPTEHAVVVTGRFSDRYGSVALDFADFTSVAVPLTHGLFLYAIPAEHLKPATQLVGMRALTKRGETLINHQIPPGMPPCETALPTKEVCP